MHMIGRLLSHDFAKNFVIDLTILKIKNVPVHVLKHLPTTYRLGNIRRCKLRRLTKLVVTSFSSVILGNPRTLL